MFRTVAGCSHIRLFMAGQTTSGLLDANRVALARLPAEPCASRDKKSAVAGATTATSASRPRSR